MDTKKTKNNIVLGIGSLETKLMIIGESPSISEIEAGEPFVGRAGKLLTTILEQADFKREDVYITNVVKEPCRDGNKNRPPKQDEIEKWKATLWEEIKRLKNLRAIVTLGKVPTCLLLKEKNIKLSDYVGKRYRKDYINADIIPAFHPSFLMQYGKEYTEQTNKLFRQIKKLLEKN